VRGLYVAEQVHPVLDADRIKHLATKEMWLKSRAKGLVFAADDGIQVV
jgi:hypothetical protein